MTINRGLHPVTLKTFTSAVSAYGEQVSVVGSTSTIELAITPYTQTEVNNPVYEDVRAIATSRVNYSVAAGSEIIDGTLHYRVKQVIPGRRNQLLLQELK